MITFQDPLFEEFQSFVSPLFCSGDAGMGDLGGGVGLADGGGDGADFGGDGGAGEDTQDFTGTVDDVDGGAGAEQTEEELSGEGREGEDTEGQDQRPQQQGKSGQELLPKDLAKALRELKSAHQDSPETLRALKTLNDSHYTAKSYKEIFPSVDDARTMKAAIEAVGGTEGITSMRQEISKIEQFDRLASEGNPKVIASLADEFPDGFKRLVPAAVERLSRTDPAAYRETMRGPLLQMLEGDGLMEVIGTALEELKGGNPDRASAQLGRIAQWYNGLKSEEQSFRNRYQDPKLQQFEQRERDLEQKQVNIYKETVVRDLRSYRNETMRPSINQALQGRTVSEKGRARFEQNVVQEIANTLNANEHYNRSMADLIQQGRVEQAVSFAKPFIDRARRDAITAVATDLFGNTKPAPRPRQQATAPRTGEQRQPQPQSDKPIPIRSKPQQTDVDWTKDPKGTLFVTSKAFLKNGKFVTWAQPQR